MQKLISRMILNIGIIDNFFYLMNLKMDMKGDLRRDWASLLHQSQMMYYWVWQKARGSLW